MMAGAGRQCRQHRHRDRQQAENHDQQTRAETGSPSLHQL
jgi:hypothetical protein